ncbi:MAG: ABC transporter ATP-binding protein, partial [Gammaproteobacteria bacterium]
QPAVSALGFSVERGEIFGFLGPSGAGKSTTQRILTGLLHGYDGSARVFGREVKDWDGDYYERIGVSFELPNHYLKLTGAENLKYFRSLYKGQTRAPEELLQAVNLLDSGGMRVGHYSKGMMTRLGVARAMIHDPDLLFMDEPTAGLDPASARLIKELIKGRRDAGTTIFLTTHDMATVDELCDRAAFIVDGEIRLIDSPRSLKLQHGKRVVRVEYLDGDTPRAAEYPLEGLGDNADFLELIKSRDVQTMHTLEATLEDIFIDVTGRSLS